jgi:hypothetical protein
MNFTINGLNKTVALMKDFQSARYVKNSYYFQSQVIWYSCIAKCQYIFKTT